MRVVELWHQHLVLGGNDTSQRSVCHRPADCRGSAGLSTGLEGILTRRLSIARIAPVLLFSAVVLGCEGAYESNSSSTAVTDIPSYPQLDDMQVGNIQDKNPFLGSWRLGSAVEGDDEMSVGPVVIVSFRANGTQSISVSNDLEHLFCEEPQTSCTWCGTYSYSRTTVTLDEEGGPEPGPDTMLYARCGGRLILMDYGDNDDGVRLTFVRARRDGYVKDCAGPFYSGCDYIPVSTGNRWVYNTGTMEVEGSQHAFEDGVGIRIETDLVFESTIDISFWNCIDAAGTWLCNYVEETGEYENDIIVGLASFLPDSMYLGAQWTLLGEFGADLESVEIEVVGMEAVTVPAGTFENCLRIRYTLIMDEGYTDEVLFARDVGIVKAEQISQLVPTNGYFLLVNEDYPVGELQSASVDGVNYP